MSHGSGNLDGPGADGLSTEDEDDDGRMASAARRAFSVSLCWRGSNGIPYFSLGRSGFSSINSTELIDDDTSALTSPIGALSGARGQLASESLVSRGGWMVVDGRGGAER